jgi:hypothetical protein
MQQGKEMTVKERLKLFCDNNIKAFITDTENNYYFCFIKEVTDSVVTVKNFAGKRAGQEETFLIIDIKELKLYKEKI